VRDGADDLGAAIRRLTPHDVSDAFDLEPAIRAAGPWIDRALAETVRMRALLKQNR
jgi:hypothetical protein